MLLCFCKKIFIVVLYIINITKTTTINKYVFCWFSKPKLIKLWTELTKLNLTASVVKNTIQVQIMVFCIDCNNAFMFIFFICIIRDMFMKIIIERTSTKSQFHHPPQESSCSAQKQPKKIAIIIIRNISTIFFDWVAESLLFLKNSLYKNDIKMI